MSRETKNPVKTAPLKLVKSQRNPPDLKDLQPSLKKLLTMLSYKRPGGSDSETAFNRRYLVAQGAKPDAFGNHWLTIPGNPDILFSSHTDTVHKTPGMQTVYYGDGYASVDDECLGADCGVGVWLMLEMIKARVPGTYIFHAFEETGGQGSNFIATKAPELIQNHKFAVAFDRKGDNEIITEQWEGRTASDEFATSLAAILKPLAYKPSPNGSFTDTANYAHLIPECTNIGVGYYMQHQKTEVLDICHAAALRDALCGANWAKLTNHRTAQKPVRTPYKSTWWAKNGGGWTAIGAKAGAGGTSDGSAKADDAYGADNAEETLTAFVRRCPTMVASLLEDMGVTIDDIENSWYDWDRHPN